MARTKLITRTFKITTVEVMGIDMSTQAIEKRTVEFPGELLVSEALDCCRDYFGKADAYFAPAHVLNVTHKEELYGLDEKTFLAMAQKLPPRTGNSNGTDEVSED